MDERTREDESKRTKSLTKEQIVGQGGSGYGLYKTHREREEHGYSKRRGERLCRDVPQNVSRAFPTSFTLKFSLLLHPELPVTLSQRARKKWRQVAVKRLDSLNKIVTYSLNETQMPLPAWSLMWDKLALGGWHLMKN